MAADRPSAAVPGPRDRESFFEAQRRNRRATWRLSAASGMATMVMGIPLALVITPLLYAATLILADIVNIWAPVPASFWQRADEVARYGLVVIGWLAQGQAADPRALLLGGAILLLPGAILSAGFWLGINALFRRAGVGGALLALKARDPNPSDLKELQLSDVIEEMAIAAGLAAPRILLIDARAANAAVIGTSPDDARIVVSRGLLDQLNRDELEGALAHLVASVGNGDLRIAFRVTSVFETCGLLVALINSPFGSQSRGTLWRVVRFGLRRKANREASAEEAAAVAALLTRGAGLETDDIDRVFDTTGKKSLFRSIRAFLLFPIFFTNVAIKLSLWFFSLSMLEPCFALLWRTRKYLADASAVQLTRNPDGLAQALRKLNAQRGAIPGGQWASHLFLVSPGGTDRVSGEQTISPQQEKLAQIWAACARGNDPAPSSAASTNLLSVTGEIMATGRAAMAGDQNAIARMTAFRQAAAAALGTTPEELPSLAVIAGSQHGDALALLHLRRFSGKLHADGEAAEDSSSIASGAGYMSFHPSLKRRLKRLNRMGAHVELKSEKWNAASVMFLAGLALLLGPLVLAAAALLVLLIAIMTMASLAFLTLWLAVIHKLFVVFLHP